jgi:hypothetical protein
MPRIYAPNEEHVCDWAQVPFVHGAAAVADGVDTAHFLADGYTIDTSKHALELWDDFTIAELDAFYAWLGGTVSGTDTRYQKIRKIETSLSVKYITALSVASAAATTGVGKTKFTVTSPGEYDYYVKTHASTSPDILYQDVVDDTWTLMVLDAGVQDEYDPESDTKYTVVRVTAAGRVIGIAKGTITVKAEG